MDVQRDQNEQILVLPCVNDLYFLYKHVINALDSLGLLGYEWRNSRKQAAKAENV